MERLADLKRQRVEPQQMALEDLLLLLLDGDRPKERRVANPTQRAFVYDPAEIKFFMGAAGSAKTSALCSAGWLRALLTPGSKGLVARANYNDLVGTTGLRMQEMLSRLPKGVLLDRDKSPPMKWYIQAVPALSPEGDVLDESPSMMTFMGLQDGLGSYEFDWAAIDEVSEVDEKRVFEVDTRLRHRPKSWAEDYSARCLMGAFNPTDTFHWLYTACTGLDHTGRKVREPWAKLFVAQPRENLRNLPFNYYDRLTSVLPEDMRIRLIEGKWGATFEGQPAYREFKYDIHTRYNLVERYDSWSPLFRFWDFGYRRPWCGWFQLDMPGRLLGFKEMQGENLEIRPFVELCRARQELWFPNHREMYDFGDPAARQKKDTGSTLVALSEVGITLRYKLSGIEASMRTVRLWLEKLIDGEAAFQFDRDGMPTLINALRGGYRLDACGEKPVKDGVYDHSADGFRYGVDNVVGGGASADVMNSVPTSIEYVPMHDRY